MKGIKCSNCGFVGFAASNCKRCKTPITNTSFTDEKTVTAIKSKQSFIMGIGGFISLVLSFGAVFVIEDGAKMAISFIVIFAVGLLLSWFIASLAERNLLGGNKLKYQIKPAEKVSVFVATIFFAYFVALDSAFGFFLALFLIIFINGALFLYDYRMKRGMRV